LPDSAWLRDVGDAGGLYLNYSVRYQLNQSGHQGTYSFRGFKEFDPDREMLTTAAGGALRMDAMMRSKS
jgi:hypothetical protein